MPEQIAPSRADARTHPTGRQARGSAQSAPFGGTAEEAQIVRAPRLMGNSLSGPTTFWERRSCHRLCDGQLVRLCWPPA
jgi:hypothetical protein